jgi:hypothetical protein
MMAKNLRPMALRQSDVIVPSSDDDGPVLEV